MSRRRILVIGASGQLGGVMARAWGGDEVVEYTSASLDLTDHRAVQRAVAEAAPHAIINCAAFNDVDGAEARPLDALAVNAFAVRSLARAADASGAVLVHYGTDFVFDGRATAPYREDDPTAPASVYAASKQLGEWFALDAPRAFVLRVESLFGSLPGRSGRRGTLDGIVDGLRQGREVRVFTDRVVSPSYIPDIVAATRHLVDTGAAPGVYHCVNAGFGSWHEVASEAAAIIGVAARLVPVTVDQVPMKAMRPRFCALAPDKLAAAGFVMPTWRDALRRWLAGSPAPEPAV